MRPAFTLGGRGGGIARSEEEYERIVERGLAASPIGQVLLDQSVLGWGEFELEVMRDLHDNVVIVCSIENVDPMGVHTGDSVTVAPQQTLTDRLYQRLRDQAIAVIRAVGVETGGSNVQFAVDPVSEEILVIEMNPRVSRSSALASKATGFPIAKIAARLAVGYALEEIPNDITQITPASFEPTIDYVVVKWPRFAFEKFPGVNPDLSTHMKSVGEAMAIGRTFQQAFAKALRSRELDIATKLDGVDTPTLLEMLERPASDRYDVVLEAFRKGASVDDVRERTSIDPWFLEELRALALDPDAALAGERSYKSVDTCAAEFPARTPYYYSGWERRAAHEVERGERPSVVILGSGPNRIGQGIEFDYCCVHAAMTVRESGRDAVMINCNPETVSTDYDTSDRLYFEPLTLEDVLGVIEIERPEGVVVQFGGQTPLKLAHGLQEAGVPILGTSVDNIDLAEDRGRFGALLERLGYQAPPYATAHSVEEALEQSEQVGFPLLVRPSYVLGGRAMEIVYSRDGLADYLGRHARDGRAIYLDRFLENAIEVDVDALCDGEDVWIGGIMQHVEEAGIHSGDSACVLPPHSLGHEMLDEIRAATAGIALGLGRRRAHERPVRRPRRRALRDRGQPARLAHRALRVQGDRGAAGQARLPDHARRADRRPRPARGADAGRSRQRQGGGAALRPPRGLRRDPRARDALHRRGHGDRARLPDRLRQGAGGGRRRAARQRHGLHHADGLRQARRGRASRRSSTTTASASSPRAAPRRPSSAWASPPPSSRRSARARPTSSTGSRTATSTSWSTRRRARARARTAGRSAAPPSRAGSRA